MTTPSSTPLRVLYSFPDTLGAPGIGTTAWNQVQSLVGLGHEVRVYATAVAHELPHTEEVVTTLTLAGKRVPHRAIGRRRAYRYHDRRVGKALRRLAGEVDIVHCWPRATVETAAAARDTGIASVREAPNTHTAYAYERVAEETARLGLAQPEGHSHTADEYALDLEEREYAAVDLVAVPSEFSRRTFLDRGFSPERLGLHQYGFDPARFPAPEASRNGARRACALSSPAAASRARACTTPCRRGWARARPSAAPSRSAAPSIPGTTTCSQSGSRTRASRSRGS